MAGSLAETIKKAFGSPAVKSRALTGGDIADVSLLTLADGTELVAKRPRMDQPDTTAIEAHMLQHLAARSALPVPAVLHQEKGLLILSYIPHKGATDRVAASKNVADHIAALHRIRPAEASPYYGFSSDTVIGPLPQINTPKADWCAFFTEHRLLAMARSCLNTNRFSRDMMKRTETLVQKLPDILPAAPDSSLLHGDLWSGNVLLDTTRAAAFIDPAVSYGHREMDIAFALMMGGMTDDFLKEYNALYPLDPGFMEERLALYQLWPLLVHARLFGGGYTEQIDGILKQYGC